MPKEYPIISDWNNGQTEKSSVRAYDAFADFGPEKISKIIYKIREDSEVADFYEMVFRMMELKMRDESGDRDNSDKCIDEGEVLRNCLYMAMSGNKKENKIAAKILKIREEIK